MTKARRARARRPGMFRIYSVMMFGGLLAKGCELDVDHDELVILPTVAVEDALAPACGQAARAGEVQGELLPCVVAWDKRGASDGVEDHRCGCGLCLALARWQAWPTMGEHKPKCKH
jgi:hypothetical protein